MALLTTNIHLSADDRIRANSRDNTAWIELGPDASIFGSPAKLTELRDAIDAHLIGLDALGKIGRAA